MIRLEGLALAYGAGAPVFRDVDLEVPRGSFVAIVGASGVGKSTLLRILAGLSPPTAGRVTTETVSDPGRLPIALVFQDARLLPWRRVLANVTFGVERLKVPAAERRSRALAALELVGLAHLADRWPHQLSGGQRQRVALARALAVEPDLLLMDEPFGALDALTRESLQDELLRVWRATGKTIVFVTHDIDEAVYLADRVVVMAGAPAGIQAVQAIDTPRPRPRGDGTARAFGDAIRGHLGMDGEGI
jgi:NitT/TauT family transport system ATP-binding protein